MFRTIVAALVLLLAAASAHAVRVIEQPERPYELSLAQVTLPSSTSGGLSIKQCSDCTYTTHVLTNRTEFYINGQLMPFAEFKRIADELRGAQRESTFVGVFVDVESGRVTRVKLRNRNL